MADNNSERPTRQWLWQMSGLTEAVIGRMPTLEQMQCYCRMVEELVIYQNDRDYSGHPLMRRVIHRITEASEIQHDTREHFKIVCRTAREFFKILTNMMEKASFAEW